jgi:hypothetical protein
MYPCKLSTYTSPHIFIVIHESGQLSVCYEYIFEGIHATTEERFIQLGKQYHFSCSIQTETSSFGLKTEENHVHAVILKFPEVFQHWHIDNMKFVTSPE